MGNHHETKRARRLSGRVLSIGMLALALTLLPGAVVVPAQAQTTISPESVQAENGVVVDKPIAVQPSQIAVDPKPALTLPHNLSPWNMFMGADIVVKSIMGLLAFASLVTWIIWLAKTLELLGARMRARRALKVIQSALTLQEAIAGIRSRSGPVPAMLRAAGEEVHRSDAAIAHAGGDGLKERVASILSRIEALAGRRMTAGTGILATIGSTAPFVGLLGTVWGIMNAFIGISEAQTTNLAVVAPGIAEALLATAIGLAAAIPAVVIYNVFARSVTGYRHLLSDAAAGVERLVSRDLDFRKVPAEKSSAARLQAAE